MSKKIIIDEPDADPTVKNLTDDKPKKEIAKRYLFIAQPDIYADLNALVISRNVERIKTGGRRAYSLNQLLNDLVREYLEQDEIKAEVAKAHKTLKI